MSTAPAITFSPSGLEEVPILENQFSVYLYAQDDVFDAYYDWSTPVGAPSTTFERNAGENYSGYVIRFECNISAADVKNGSGCCL